MRGNEKPTSPKPQYVAKGQAMTQDDKCDTSLTGGCYHRDGKVALNEDGKCKTCGIHNTTLKYDAQKEKDKAPAEQPKEPLTINDMLFTIMSNQLVLLRYMGFNVQRQTGIPGLKESAAMHKVIEEMEINTIDTMERMEK